MAKQTIVVVTDDLDGTEGASTITFGLDGQSYEIDLNDKNEAALRKALQPFVDKASRVGSKTGTRGKRSDLTSTKEIRAWAKQQGFDVPDRGRLPKEVTDAWEGK